MLATSTSKSEELNIWKTDQTCFNTSTHYSVLQNTFSLLLKSASFRKMTVSPHPQRHCLFQALIIIAFEKPDYTLLSVPIRVNDTLSKPFLTNVFSAAIGVIWAALTAVSVLYMVQYRLIDSSAVPAFCFVSFILTQITVLNECKREQSMFDRNVRVNGAYAALLAILLVFFLLVFLVPSVGKLFGVVPLNIYGVCGAVIPCIVVTLVYEVYKLLGEKGDKA